MSHKSTFIIFAGGKNALNLKFSRLRQLLINT